jgi:hypothetical protein
MPTKKAKCTVICLSNETPFCGVLKKMHEQGLFTHMPFVVNPEILLFSLGCSNPHFPNKDWRVGYIDARAQTWRLLDTGLPAGTVECSPSAYIDFSTNKIVVCFLASTPACPTYFMYKMVGSSWDSLCGAFAVGAPTYHGFVNNELFVTSRFFPNNDIHIRIETRTGRITRLAALSQYIHKISYVSGQPTKIIVSLQKKENPRHAKELLLDTADYSTVHVIRQRQHKLYKTSLYENMILYGKKLHGFDERQICGNTSRVQFDPSPLHCHLVKLPTKNG